MKRDKYSPAHNSICPGDGTWATAYYKLWKYVDFFQKYCLENENS